MALLSGRGAARILAGVGLSLSASQQLLATGIAGPSVRVGHLDLYDELAVRGLAGRPTFDHDELEHLFPGGLLLVRVPRARRHDATAVWPATRAAIEGPWRLRSRQVHYAEAGMQRSGGLPAALLVAGFVVAGATVTGLRWGADGTRLELTAPGPWFAALQGHRIVGGGQAVEVVRPVPPGPPLRAGSFVAGYGPMDHLR